MRREKVFEENDDEITPDEDVMNEIAAAERLGAWDFVLAGFVAAGVYLLQTLWSYPAVPPSLWEEVCVATGARPAYAVTPGLWNTIASFCYRIFGMGGGTAALKTAGHLSLAVITIFMYSFLREVLTFVMRARPQRSPRRKLVMRIAAAIGALSFAVCDPVWSAGQFFSQTTLLLGLTIGSIEFFFAFLRKGALKYSYVCAVLLGLLMAETPMGLVLTMVFIALNFIVIKMLPNLESPFFKPALIEVGKWHMTFFLIAAFVAGVALNCVGFVVHDGLVPGGDSIGSLPLKYAQDYFQNAQNAASLAGWILLLGFALGPFVVSIVRFSAAADEENFLSYSTGIVFLFCGVCAFSQCASLPALWFWTYVPVNSQYLLSLCSLMCALTVSCAITILGVDSLCRDHARLAKKFFGVGDDSDDEEERVMSKGMTEKLRALGIVIVPLVLIAAVIPGRVKEATRSMLTVIDDIVEATVDEAGGVGYIFTDGKLDAALELKSRERGGDLKCINLMGIGGKNAVWLRTRGLQGDKESYESFRFDGAMGLRCWIHDKPQNLTNVAVQVGFDLWRRDGKALPPMGGMLSLPTSTDKEAMAKAIERVRVFHGRVLDIVANGIGDCTETSIKDTFFFAMWRLARMCLYRHDADSAAGEVEAAMAEMAMHDKLDRANELFQQDERRRLAKARNSQMQTLSTPREVLHLAMVRADFNLGSAYAEIILESEPDDPDANFVMAMHYIRDLGQLSMGEEYLKRCLLRKPDQPAFYNNLAMVQMELGKLDAAEANVKKALELIPSSAAVLETKRSIEKAKAERAAEDAKKKAGGKPQPTP